MRVQILSTCKPVSVTTGILFYSLDFAVREAQIPGDSRVDQTVTLRLNGDIVASEFFDNPSTEFGHFEGIFISQSDQVTFTMVSNHPLNHATGFGQIFFDNATVVVQVTLEEMLSETAQFIMDEVDSGNVDPELEGSLLAKIDAALAALDRDNPNDAKVAMNDLKALINQVEAQTDKKITLEAVAEIIQQANTIITTLGG